MGDNSYRYAWASDNVNNYICLGIDGTYSSGNLYQWSKLSSYPSNVAYADSQGNKLMFLSKNEIAAGQLLADVIIGINLR